MILSGLNSGASRITPNVTFASLDDGTRYPQQVLLHVPAKKIDIKTINSGYKKLRCEGRAPNVQSR
jgi:hypothetical protein